MMTFTIKVKDGRLADIKFQTFGCGAAIAVSSMVSEMAMGKTLEEAAKITNETVAEELGGLPKNKLHCSNLGADALHKAIENYREKQSAVPSAGKKAGRAAEEEECACPYCDGPLIAEGTEENCQLCQVDFTSCPTCGELNKKGAASCHHCGIELTV